MLEHPVKQSPLKPNIATEFFALNPFMPQNLVPFREKLLVQARVLEQITGIHGCIGAFHSTYNLSGSHPRAKSLGQHRYKHDFHFWVHQGSS